MSGRCSGPDLVLHVTEVLQLAWRLQKPEPAACRGRWVPVRERSRSLALVYSGMYSGSILGLALSPHMIEVLHWPSVFYIFGSLGVVWFALWNAQVHARHARQAACCIPWPSASVSRPPVFGFCERLLHVRV